MILERAAHGWLPRVEQIWQVWHLILRSVSISEPSVSQLFEAMDNVELLQLAIRRLADEKKNGRASVADDDLLSRLIFQVLSIQISLYFHDF